ncbi:unnamed protein product [Adineta steineri]|uniref:NACHT domain-containing protein n=2 Tax=Adineta steineri TaxID=433720 RepID=A0A818NR33_9BILA|nr:unnamed protein product [Adineta steineri]CAF3608959.1 unnamed protein product [Adineta steineri]
MTALAKLPSHPTTVWRGIANISGSDYYENDMFTWWRVNSCSLDAGVASFFTGEKGTLFCINTTNGKDISGYSSANDEEKEIVLMPGTRLCVKSKTRNDTGFDVVHLEECTSIPEGKHVMISYDLNSQEIISKISHDLQLEHIPIWCNEQKEMANNLKKSLAEGVENAAVVCCFMTPDYQKSDFCQLELQYAQKRQKRIIPCMLTDIKVWKPSDWLKSLIKGHIPIDFHNVSESSTMQRKIRELIHRIENQPSTSQCMSSQGADGPSYLFELIKYEYKRNSRIERFMNPAKSFPVDQSYINLAMIETKEQQEKEKKLKQHDKQNSASKQRNDKILGTYEEIYGTKTTIDVKNIFDKCKVQTRKVLLLGRAGIGKSTFCQYVTYKWAKRELWTQYDLVILIRLRKLTESRYLSAQNYSPIDLVEKEYFPFGDFSNEEKQQLKEHCNNCKVLWILDGYDEFVHNIPDKLAGAFDYILKTQHHILTSRPYAIALSYDVQMEITGFTNDNIEKYIVQFFDQIKDDISNGSFEGTKLLHFLKTNSSIWGIAHIPVNLELICSLWGDTDWSKKKTLTMTTLQTVCKTLGAMGEKAATNEVISALFNTLQDADSYVRQSACDALRAMGEKTATNEVISSLINALQDEHLNVRRAACKARRAISQKAATNEVTSSLIITLRDEDPVARKSAFAALKTMGEKAATIEVISSLITTLRDEDSDVRKYACAALETMGEAAATNEMISALIIAVRDEHFGVRLAACAALGATGEKAATNEMVSALINALQDKYIGVRKSAETKNDAWLPIVTYTALLQGVAVTIIEDKIMIYHMSEVSELNVSSRELKENLVNSFKNQQKEFLENFIALRETGIKTLE